jgi:hypothetical protein
MCALSFRGRLRSSENEPMKHPVTALVLLVMLAAIPVAAGEIGDASDHLLTGFPLLGAHATVECQQCHSRGVFAGMPTRCTYCHAQGGPVAASVKPLDHIPTTMECDVCHGDRSWHPVRFDHVWATSPCAACHNNATARGKPVNHIPSGSDCANCHSTRTWRGASFDHSGATAPCASCHNNVNASGKPPNHIPTSQSCDACHGTTSWKGSSLRGEEAKPPMAEGKN